MKNTNQFLYPSYGFAIGISDKGGAFAPLLKQFLEAGLESGMDGYLSEFERSKGI